MCKKVTTLVPIFMMVLVASLFGSNDFLENKKGSFQVMESNDSGLIVKFSLPEYELRTETVSGKQVKVIACESEGKASLSGIDEVPLFTSMLAVPNTGSFELEVIEKSTSTIKGDFKISRTALESFDDKDPLEDTRLTLGKLSQPVIMRDLRTVSLTLSPFQYNESKNELEVVSEVTYRLKRSDNPGVNELNCADNTISASFLPLYRSIIDNFDLISDRYTVNYDKKLLIIHGHSTDQQYINKLNEFIRWKRQKGFKVTSASTQTIGSSNTAVKAYIQNKYNNVYTRPDYVLLIGDTSGALSISCWNGSGDTDYPYSYLGGNDTLGDVFIGRMPAETVSHFLTMAEKVFIYERDIVPMPDAWYNQMLLVGDTQPSGQSCQYVNYYARDISERVNPNYNYTELYGPQPSSSSITSAINQGVAIYNYRGHIGMSGWDMPNEGSFNNANKLPHCILNTCSTGNFSGTDVTDSFVRFGSPALPKGGLTAIGMATSSTHTLLNNVLTTGTLEGIFVHGMRDMSAPLLHSKWLLHEVYHDLLPSHSISFPEWCNLMGDPTVEVFVGTPEAMQVSCRESVRVGDSIYSVMVSDSNATNLKDVCVTFMYNNVQTIAYTNEFGYATLPLPNDMVEGETITLTVSNHDSIPFIHEIDVFSAADVEIDSYTFSDENNGNSDSIFNAGEELQLTISLRNNSQSDISNAPVTLESVDPYISIINGEAEIQSLPVEGIGEIAEPIILSLDPQSPDGHVAELVLSYDDIDMPIELTIVNGDVCINSYQLYNESGVLDAGDLVNLSLSVENIGSYPLSRLSVELSSESELVYFPDREAFFGNTNPGQVVTNITDGLSIGTREQFLTETDIPLVATFTGDNGFNQEVEFTIQAATPSLGNPSGPDAFGHYIYHSNDTEWPDAPVYDWVEIAPQQGGSGTLVYLTDSTHDSDNSDLVNIIAFDNAQLPFDFTFYGVDYDEVYICSNGFISFLPTEVSTARNLPIPGPMTPDPIIAPFWDNLEVHSDGGVYYYHDTVNSTFIIEWYNVKNSYNTSYSETFQIILYDPDLYPTSTGDGLVKIQYQEFNDIDAGNPASYTPGHGQYCTVGIGDHTGTDGMSYLFDLDYLPTAQQITDNTALIITGEPYVMLTPDLDIEDFHFTETNGNGFIEPGETVQFGVTVTNSGTADATSILGTAITESPYATIIEGAIPSITINMDESITTTTGFEMLISETTPLEEHIVVTVNLTDGIDTWSEDVEFFITAPMLEHLAFRICDYETGNGDGEPNAGETLYLVHEVVSYSTVDMHDVTVDVDTDDYSVTLLEHVDELKLIPAGGVMQSWFKLTLPDNLNVGDETTITVTYEKEDWFNNSFDATLETDMHTYQSYGMITGTVHTEHEDAIPGDGLVKLSNRHTTLGDGSVYRMFKGFGNHTIEAHMNHYLPAYIDDVELNLYDEMVASGIDLSPQPLPLASELEGSYNNPEFTLTWVEPTHSEYDIIENNVYKAIGEGDYNLVEITDTNQYVETINTDGVYHYRVEVVYNYSTSFLSDVFTHNLTGSDDNNQTQLVTKLYGNYPNPFNPTTDISFCIAKKGHVKIDIYNVKGQHIHSLVDDVKTAGNHVVKWEGTDKHGKPCGSGLYMYKFETINSISIGKAMLLK